MLRLSGPKLFRRVRHAVLPDDEPAGLPVQVQPVRVQLADDLLDLQLLARAGAAVCNAGCAPVLEPRRRHAAVGTAGAEEL